MKDILKQREERIKLLIDRGYTADIEKGIVYNPKGVIVKGGLGDYLFFGTHINNIAVRVHHHQFIYYLATNEVVEMIDHKDKNKYNNRIDNLRKTNYIHNSQNTNAKGYTWNKNRNKWMSKISLNGKTLHLGYFIKEDDAKKAYLDAKKIYHITQV